ncbi:MAG: DUF192 domain-containing protein [Gammaproteobacteria bacterium]|nr:DUF192 domain-containing protein [Gammaproteobacteria bacterium]
MSHWYSFSTKFKNRALAALFFLFISSISYAFVTLDTIEVRLGQTTYQVELALTPVQRRKGLMHREQLASNAGMLLVYPKSGDHRVWMKNVRIPLRVLWIDDRFKVIHVMRLEPCQLSPCPVFSAPVPARYILELSDDNHDVEPGDIVEGLNGL